MVAINHVRAALARPHGSVVYEGSRRARMPYGSSHCQTQEANSVSSSSHTAVVVAETVTFFFFLRPVTYDSPRIAKLKSRHRL